MLVIVCGSKCRQAKKDEKGMLVKAKEGELLKKLEEVIRINKQKTGQNTRSFKSTQK